MPKNIEDIITPEKRRSIRDIPIPPRKNVPTPDEWRRKVNDSFPLTSSFPPSKEPSFPEEQTKPSRRSRKGLWFAIIFASLVFIFALLSLFNGATLTYVPQSAALSFNNDTYKAYKSGEENLLYSIVKLSGEKGLEAPASGEEEVSRKASGVIVVYNEASSEPQRFVENTRFQTPEGLVYRTPTAVVIPGKKTVSGKTQPGSLEITVYADVAGTKSNIGLSDFSLPGLAGSPRFTSVYARSKTPMSGGFVGPEKIVNAQDKTKAEATLKSALREELISNAKAQVPEGFILIPPLSGITFENLAQTESVTKSNVTLNMRADFQGVMFKKNDLFTHMALGKIDLASGESIDILPLEDLTFSFSDSDTSGGSSLSSDTISFKVSGQVKAVWRVDEVALKKDLIGKSKSNVVSILHNYPNIISAKVTTRPFWKQSLPNNSGNIVIKQLPVE